MHLLIKLIVVGVFLGMAFGFPDKSEVGPPPQPAAPATGGEGAADQEAAGTFGFGFPYYGGYGGYSGYYGRGYGLGYGHGYGGYYRPYGGYYGGYGGYY